MTDHDILKVARECGFTISELDAYATSSDLITFAKRIAAMQREIDAGICEARNVSYVKDGERWLKGENGKPDVRIKDLAPNLESAYEMEMILKHGSVIHKMTESDKCAAAIREQSDE